MLKYLRMNGKTKCEMKNWKYPRSYGFHYFRLVYYFHYLMTTNIYISPYNILPKKHEDGTPLEVATDMLI